MTKINNDIVVQKIIDAVISASSRYTTAQKKVFEQAHDLEENQSAKWVLDKYLENERIASKISKALCDDTGIPHIVLEIGPKSDVTYDLIEKIHFGLAEGLRQLPGRPMAVKGNDIERVEQSAGLYKDPGMMVSAPLLIRKSEREGLRLHILLQGGGPEIRSKTYRVYHKRSFEKVVDEVIQWAKEEVKNLGCTPCTPCIGIGRSHYEATSMMLFAMIDGKFDVQSDVERKITDELNQTEVGPIGLGGKTTALATFMRVGPQRASGVRIVSLRLSCSVEPRYACIEL